MLSTARVKDNLQTKMLSNLKHFEFIIFIAHLVFPQECKDPIFKAYIGYYIRVQVLFPRKHLRRGLMETNLDMFHRTTQTRNCRKLVQSCSFRGSSCNVILILVPQIRDWKQWEIRQYFILQLIRSNCFSHEQSSFFLMEKAAQ